MNNPALLHTRLFTVALFATSLIAACNTTNQQGNNTSTRNVAATSTPVAAIGANHAVNASGGVAVMSHGATQSSPDAAGAPYDLQFLDTMSAHHQAAVNMAKQAVEKAQRAELKEFARRIVEDQEQEIAGMRGLREQWYAGKPPAVNMEMRGMKSSMIGMDMTKLDAATGSAYDLLFLDMMTPHHQGAIVMAQEALTRAEHTEIKPLAQTIINAQEQEIARMNKWKDSWR